jgi:FixJ family two-component response regulator
LLLTDFQMPRMDGLSLIDSVRELHPKMPVLLMTGSRVENRPRSYAVLKKPIRREALLRAVRSAIALFRNSVSQAVAVSMILKPRSAALRLR